MAASEVNPEHALIIQGVIADGNLLPIGEKLMQASVSGETEVDLIIDSPGGSVSDGFLFISVMEEVKSTGMNIRCFVPTMAASMAFGILTHCAERYVLDRAVLMWHRARVMIGGLFGAALSGPESFNIAKELSELDNLTLAETIAAMPDQSSLWVRESFEAQSLHLEKNLCDGNSFCTSSPTIPNLLRTEADPKTPRTVQKGFRNLMHPKHLVYINPSFTGAN